MTENVVESYGWKDSADLPSDRYIAPRILAILRDLQVKRVLDLGCGSGALCEKISKIGIDVVGVEYDKGGVTIARQARPSNRFYNFGVQDDPADLLKSETTFDAVVSTEVVEHLFSPHLLPRYAARVLNSGGYLIITTPYHGYLKNVLLAACNKWDHHHNPMWHGGHVKFWSRTTLTQLLQENGFDVVDFCGVGRAPFLWKSMVLVARLKAQIVMPSV